VVIALREVAVDADSMRPAPHSPFIVSVLPSSFFAGRQCYGVGACRNCK